jgi:hypothetical protein
MPFIPPTRIVIQPGSLRKPLLLFTRSDVTDTDVAGGAGQPNYVPLFPYPVFAQDTAKRARYYDEAGKLITTVYHTYTVRFHKLIVAGLYIKDPDFTNMLYIQGVIDPDGTRHWQQLDAEDIEG